MKKNKKLSILLPTLYLVAVVTFSLTLVALGKGMNKFKNNYKGNDYTINNVFEETNPVINEEPEKELDEPSNILTEPTISENKIIRPYTSKEVTLSKKFYDENSDEQSQQESIIYYKGSYIQNKGAEYSSKESFEVLNVIDGTVKTIKKDSNLGYIVTIEHDNELVTLYQYLSEVKVSEGANITSGEVIGTSGKSILEDDNYTLHFEVTHKSNNIDPESLYTLTVEDFE